MDDSSGGGAVLYLSVLNVGFSRLSSSTFRPPFDHQYMTSELAASQRSKPSHMRNILMEINSLMFVTTSLTVEHEAAAWLISDGVKGPPLAHPRSLWLWSHTHLLLPSLWTHCRPAPAWEGPGRPRCRRGWVCPETRPCSGAQGPCPS